MQGYAREVARLAPILDAHLAGRTWMLGGDAPTYADFRVGDIFPFEQDAKLDFSAFPNIRRLSAQLARLPHWCAPFEGL
jgi:glutathione S-transferase